SAVSSCLCLTGDTCPPSTLSPYGRISMNSSTTGADDCGGPDPRCSGHLDGYPPSWLRDPTFLPTEPLITAITLAELSVGPLVAQTEQERAARQAHLQQAETDFDPIPLDAAAARAFGQVAASLRRSGRKPAVGAQKSAGGQAARSYTWCR